MKKSNSNHIYRIDEIIRSKIRPSMVRKEFFSLFGYNKVTMYYKMYSENGSSRRFTKDEEKAIAKFLQVPIEELFHTANQTA